MRPETKSSGTKPKIESYCMPSATPTYFTPKAIFTPPPKEGTKVERAPLKFHRKLIPPERKISVESLRTLPGRII